MAAAAEARTTTALLFSFSAVLLLLLALADVLHLQPAHRRRGSSSLADSNVSDVVAALHRFLGGRSVSDVVVAAVDRFLDGRGVLDLATRGNMILLCNAILVVILRDAGVLGAPTRRRATATAADADADAGAVAACSATPPQPRAGTSVVVWRRPRNRPAAETSNAAGRLVDRHQPPPRRRRPAPWVTPTLTTPAQAVAPWAVTALTTPAVAPWAAPALRTPAVAAAEPEEPVVTKQIVLVDEAATAAEHDHTARNATGGDGDFDRRIVAVADDDDDMNAKIAADENSEGVMELADDSKFEEFIANQWSMIRQESLQLHVGVKTRRWPPIPIS